MNVLVIARDENLIKIKHYIACYQSFFETTYELSIYNYTENIIKLLEYDRVIIDVYNMSTAVSLYSNADSINNLYVWYKDALISVKEPWLLDAMLQRALHTKKWDLVKQINRIKVDLNRIAKKEILDTYPTQLQLESTSFCNARCIMCSHYYAGNSGALDMSPKMLDKLSELLPYLDILIMHGNGEPFSSKLFNESVETYASYNIGLTTNTNLSILTDEQIEKINRSFVNIRVSCDACTKEIYEGIRRNLSFDKFLANATRLRDLCPAVEKTMASVLMRQNIKQLPEMVQFAAEYGFSEIIFSNLGTSLIVNNEMDNISHYPYFAAKQLRYAIEAGKKYGIKVTIPNSFDLSLQDEALCNEELHTIDSIPYFKSDSDVLAIKEFAESIVGKEYRVVENLADCIWEDNLYKCDGICEWCIEKPYIDLKGDVFVCCINASYRVGNIFECDSFMEIWNNETYRKIRKLFYSGKLPGFCDNCQFILNGSLKKLSVPSMDDDFYHRRHISKFYHDYCEEHGYE